MTLQHQETTEPETSEVIRLAQQMYERDRAAQERQTSLAAAAEEMGIPADYLNKAAAQIKARSIVASQRQTRRTPAVAIFLAALAVGFALILMSFVVWSRSEVLVAPAVATPAAIEAPIAPKMIDPQWTPPVPPTSRQPIPDPPSPNLQGR